nr:peptide chain release factor N(5)-glutamine methyltransferase [Prevotella sp.]
MTYRELYTRLIPSLTNDKSSLQNVCNEETVQEAKAIVRMLLEDNFAMSWTDIICGKVNELSRDSAQQLEEFMQRLEKGEPIQYVLGGAYFAGRRFDVAPGVLIPRPETADLCQWIEDDNKQGEILDVGTGSGCIAITLALDVPLANVTAWDISDKALTIARDNSKLLGSKVNFEKQDALNIQIIEGDKWDVIVNNPPYIISKEKKEMNKNVLDYEPESALFVPDEDPLLFYRSIAQYGKKTLKRGGKIYFEINPLFTDAMKEMLEKLNYNDIETRKDRFGKDRMMKCVL